MTDATSFIDNDQLQEKIQIIMRQTDYNEETVKEKLTEFNYDYLAVIKAFLGITEKTEQPVKNINQEIYRQIRYKLDANMREYNQRKEAEENSKNAKNKTWV
jgi:hypothetical protein